MTVSLFLKLVGVAFLIAGTQYLMGCNPPTPHDPIVEVAADVGCWRVQVGITEDGEPIRVPCEGRWTNAHKNVAFRKEAVCPVWMRRERRCGDVVSVASGSSPQGR